MRVCVKVFEVLFKSYSTCCDSVIPGELSLRSAMKRALSSINWGLQQIETPRTKHFEGEWVSDDDAKFECIDGPTPAPTPDSCLR